MFLLNLIFLLVTSFLCIFYFIQTQRARKEGCQIALCQAINCNNKTYSILLFFVVLIAIFVRVYQFGSVPEMVWCDEAMAAVDAKALAEYGTDRFGVIYPVHLTAWQCGQMSALLSYLMVPFIKFFGFSTLIIRLPTLLVSLVGLLCLFLFVRSVFHRNIALVVLAFAAINPWHILQSRWALDCNLYAHFFMIGVYLLYKGITGKKVFLFVSMAVFGLCMYCYGISIYTMPIFLVAACVYLLVTKQLKLWHAGVCVLVYLLISWPFFAVMIINFFKLETIYTPWFTIQYFSESVRANDILFFSEDVFIQLLANIFCLCRVIFQTEPLYDALLWSVVPGVGTMYICSVPFVLLGLTRLWKYRKKNSGIVICLLFFITGICAGLFTNGTNVWRTNIIFYPMIIMAGIGIYEIIVHFKKWRWVVLPIYIIVALLFISTYFSSYTETLNNRFYKGYADALVAARNINTTIDKYYITNHTLNNQKLELLDRSEIMGIYYLDVDSQEYYGVGEHAGSVPQRAKYVYGEFKENVVSSNEKAIYIAHEDELKYFSKEEFVFQQFNDFYLIIPVSLR